MRLLIGAGALAALMVGPIVLPQAAVAEVAAAMQNAGGPTGGGGGGGNGDEDARKDPHLTALRLTPWRPRRDSEIVVQVRCPVESTHATVASSAFNRAGSRRVSREVGMGLDDHGYGHDSESVEFDSRLGVRAVWLRCVKVEVDEDTQIRKITLISRLRTTLRVRRLIIPDLRCKGVRHHCHRVLKGAAPENPPVGSEEGGDLAN
ncbi:hypothetical protein [Streptosporangium sp. KLBMP 9127]|nr:hypothetical protein [Streptosporangium sp. KLBMP 9127]